MDKPDILQRLKQSGRLKPADLARVAQAAEERGVAAVEVLLEMALLPEQELAYFLCEAYDLPFYRLRQTQVPARALKLIGVDWMEKERTVPVSLRSDGLTLAVADPGQLPDLSPLVEYFRCPVNLVVAPLSEIDALIGRIRAGHETAAPAAPTDPSTLLSAALPAQPTQAAPASDAEMMRLLGKILLEASRGHVSDVHIGQSTDGLELRFRHDGILEDRTVPMPQTDQLRLVDLIKRLAGMDLKDRRLPKAGRMRLPVGDRDDKRDLTLKVACAPTLAGERLALRVLESPDRRFGLDDLGFAGSNLQRFRKLLRHPAGGLLLIAGPARSGRSTTLSAALAELPAEGLAFFSVENPVEQRLPGVHQLQVDPQTPSTNASALIHAAEEQDADVLLVGELDDPEAVHAAVGAAYAGCLVLGGVTAFDAISAARLLLERGAEPFLLGSALRGVVAQRLVRLLCTQCRRAVYRMPEEVVSIKERFQLTGTTLFEPAGCTACGFRGYSGRTAIQEVVAISAEVASAIRDGATAGELGRLAALSGHRTLAHDGFAKALDGSTTVAEIQRVLASGSAAAG